MNVAYSLLEARDWFLENHTGYLTCSVGETQQVCKSYREAEQFFELQELRTKGVLPKYIIQKADGSPVDPEAEYFILRLDDNADDKIHLNACRDAVLMYAMMIQSHLPVLSKELFDRYGPATFPAPVKNFVEDLSRLINRYSKENDSNTPDFILANYLTACLNNFNEASRAREQWYGTSLSPGGMGEDISTDNII